LLGVERYTGCNDLYNSGLKRTLLLKNDIHSNFVPIPRKPEPLFYIIFFLYCCAGWWYIVAFTFTFAKVLKMYQINHI
jgi:hypothetical protein